MTCFCFVLFRYVRFDKAFLLAVDMGARDLFMDIHYMAAERGEAALAEVSKRKAEQIEADGFDSLDDTAEDDQNFMMSERTVRNTYRERIYEENLIGNHHNQNIIFMQQQESVFKIMIR